MPDVSTPALPQRHAAASPRRNVTGVLAAFDAPTFDFCTAGKAAAFHFHTPQGRVVVRVSLDEATAKLRGPADSNGVPLPSCGPSQPAPVPAACAYPVEVPRQRAPSRTHAEIRAGIEAAWTELRAGSRDSITAITAKRNVSTDKFYTWLNANHHDEWLLLQRYRRGVASHAELVALGFPVTRPGASSL